MTEIVEIRSENTLLHGIVHMPKPVPKHRIGVLISIVGENSKFGTHRLYVQAADTMTQAGFFVLRYDNRGTCDSPGVCQLTFADRLADTRAALAFFRTRYQLDALVGWGMCMGSVVLVHCAASDRPEERLDGLILCSLLAYPSQASLPKYNFSRVDLPGILREMLFDGNLLRKLWQVPRKFWIYRESVPKLAARLLERYLHPDAELDRHRAAVAQVGKILARYSGPSLIIFGERDVLQKTFAERVNPGDGLGLASKRVPCEKVVVEDGNHTFSSQAQTAELLRYTMEWLDQFRRVYLPDAVQSSARGSDHV